VSGKHVTARLRSAAGSSFWAVTAYFNPVGYRSRRANYRIFRERLGVPLLAVELGFGGRFELGPGDADILVRIDGGAVLWQKERLLNLALERLPSTCRHVAWLDCDIVFADPGWVDAAERLLDEVPLAQPFDQLVHLRPGELPETAAEPHLLAWRHSFAARWRAGDLADDVFARPEGTYEHRCTCGMAWVARRDLIQRHGLYDAMILGLGDKHIAAAAVGLAADASDAVELAPAHRRHYLQWAEGFGREVAGAIGCLPGQLHHLFHGDLGNRHYLRRYRGFAAWDFDPSRDLGVAGSGAWSWERNEPALHRQVADYFLARREDEACAADDLRLAVAS
jgi:hypothetical protein